MDIVSRTICDVSCRLYHPIADSPDSLDIVSALVEFLAKIGYLNIWELANTDWEADEAKPEEQ